VREARENYPAYASEADRKYEQGRRRHGPMHVQQVSAAAGSVALVDRRRRRETVGVVTSGSALSSPPVGYRFPREVIAVAVRWYLRYGLSNRDVEELLAERGIEVDHVTV
jgi:hypothetical protein